MTSLTLKNLPDSLICSLRKAAENDRRSLTQEIIYLLDYALQRRREKPAQPTTIAETQVAAWRELAGKWESNMNIEDENKQLMEHRTPGREIEF
jgi:plasmid stability protein